MQISILVAKFHSNQSLLKVSPSPHTEIEALSHRVHHRSVGLLVRVGLKFK